MPATAKAAARPWEAGAKPGKSAKPAAAAIVAAAPLAPQPSDFAGNAPVAAPPVAPKPGDNIAPMVDEFGTVDAQIKKLEKRKKELGEQIKALGAGEYNGTKCKAVVSTFPTKRLDTDAIKAAFDEATIERFSKTSTTTKLDIKALI